MFWLNKKRKVARFGTEKRCRRCGARYVMTSIELSYLTQADTPEPGICRTCLKAVPRDPLAADKPQVTANQKW